MQVFVDYIYVVQIICKTLMYNDSVVGVYFKCTHVSKSSQKVTLLHQHDKTHVPTNLNLTKTLNESFSDVN